MSTVSLECLACGVPLEPPRTSVCSDECRRIRKREYDRGRYPSIKAEKSEYDRQYHVANSAKKIATARAWYQVNIEAKQAYDAEYREITRDRRLPLKREYSRMVRLLDPERFAATSRESSARRRARKYGNGVYLVTERDRRRALERYRHACAICESRFTEQSPLEWDHVVPIARGGSHSIGNLLPLCERCNRNKSARFITEWRAGRVVNRSTHIIRDGFGLDHERVLRVS